MKVTPTAFQVEPVVKNLPANAGDAGDMGSLHGLGWSPGGERGEESDMAEHTA